MFTGIIEEVGEVLEARDGFLRVRAERVREGTRLGDSIAIDLAATWSAASSRPPAGFGLASPMATR